MAAHFAVRLALIAFALAQFRGAIDGVDFLTATKAALTTGGLFFILGLCAGELASRITEESARREFDERIQQIEAGQSPPAS